MSRRILLIVAVVAIAAGANPDPPRKAARFVDPTAKSRVELARKAMDLIWRRLKEEKGEVDWLPYYSSWQSRHSDSLVAAATTKEELIKAYESRLKVARDYETSMTDLFKRGEKSELEVFDVKYLVLKAEGDLARAKAEEMP